MQKNILVSQDLSCYGQVSLQTALPLLSSSGANVSVLPTALLSTHTGGFKDNTYLDLTQEMTAIVAHWQKLGLHFDGAYLGYLGLGPLQYLHKNLSSLLKTNALVLIDPVMGDNGQLYSGFDETYVTAMKKIVSQAQILTPNLTEAAFLLDEPDLITGGIAAAKTALVKLHEQYQIPTILITGIALTDQQIAVVGNSDKQIWTETRPRFPTSYFGTGDIFAAALFTGLMYGLSAKKACSAAMDLLQTAILQRQKSPEIDARIGLNYSVALPNFLNHITQGGKHDKRQ